MTTQINPETLRIHIRSTLQLIDCWSPAAEELLLGTSAQESHLGYYRRQIEGPARGIYQMEPATERDIWMNYLPGRPRMIMVMRSVCGVFYPDPNALENNLAYQTIMARLHYLRVSAALPPVTDLQGQAYYWKEHYNTHFGAGKASEYIENYEKYVRLRGYEQ